MLSRIVQVILLCSVLMIGCGQRSAPSARTRAFWYWHTPFALTAGQRADLKSLGVRDLFVRAATMSFDGEKMVATLPQKWEAGWDSTWLVLNFDPGALRHFREVEPVEVATSVVEAFLKEASRGDRAGVRVAGLQLDLDCPTRLLPRYAELLKELRTRLPKGTKLSITGLQTWLTSDELREVVAQVDLFVPQFYEGHVPKTVDDSAPLNDLATLRRNIERVERLGVPYLVGIPAYTQGLIFDPTGRLAGPYRTLTPLSASMNPLLQRIPQSRGVEDRFVFRAVKPNADGKGLGYTLVFRQTTPAIVQGYDAEVARSAGSNCQGTCLFRLPDPGEGLALPAVAHPPDLKVVPLSGANPWAIVEGQTGSGSALRLQVKNLGGPTLVDPGALVIDLRLVGTHLSSLAAGGCASAQAFLDDPVTVGRVGLLRANGVRFSRPGVGEGGTFTAGPLGLRGKGEIVGEWRAKDLEGHEIKGTIGPIHLGAD